MEGLGCEVFDAYNGHQALSLLRAHPEIQVLFADVRMPGMSGTELAEVAQRLRPDLRIVLTSGYVGPTDVPAHIPFIPKPWRADDIAGAVDPARLIQLPRRQTAVANETANLEGDDGVNMASQRPCAGGTAGINGVGHLAPGPEPSSQ